MQLGGRQGIANRAEGFKKLRAALAGKLCANK